MRVLFIIQQLQLRGAEIFASDLASALGSRGIEVHVASLFPGDGKLEHRYPDIRFISLGANRSRRLLDVPAMRRISELVRLNRYDLVQTNAGDTLKYAVISKFLYRWRVPIALRNASVVGKYIRNSLIRSYNSFLVRNVDAVISVSQNVQHDFLKVYHRYSGFKFVIPVGVPVRTIVASRSQKDQIVHIGGFTFEKNHEGLLRIFSKVLSLHHAGPHMKNVSLVLVGDGPLRSSIEKRVLEMGLESQVTFAGAVENPTAILEDSKVLVLPSVIEGLPAVLLEALTAGVPVVAYNVGGVAEIISHKQTGLLVDPGDEDGFAQGVVYAMTDSAGLQAIIKQGAEKVSRDFSIDNVVSAFVSAYNLITSKS